MTLPNNSILVTPGSGETLATHSVSSKEYPVMMEADASGHLFGSKPVYCAVVANQVHVAGANTVHWDLFNADAALIVKVVSIRQIPDITTAVTGIVFAWKLATTSAVGTGGSTVTPFKIDNNDAALDVDITCRSKPSGGATEVTILFNYAMHSEETNASTINQFAIGGTELIIPWEVAYWGQGLTLRQNQGLRCVQITNSNAGNTAWNILFTVE